MCIRMSSFHLRHIKFQFIIRKAYCFAYILFVQHSIIYTFLQLETYVAVLSALDKNETHFKISNQKHICRDMTTTQKPGLLSDFDAV